ncbi:MAG: hypothetical protein E7546_04120 [Ruminococcaceae bacterium]|nr:hypothetical protein [Oscillospiraceae bacterium]
MAKKRKELKRVKGKEFFNYKKRRGDRTDGWKVRFSDPTYLVVPHIMPTRADAQVYFEEEVNTEALDKFVRQQRRENPEMPELSRLIVVMAAATRAFSRYPKINRFCAGKQVYARNHFCMSLTLKKSMRTDASDATVKPFFQPNYNLKQVYDTVIKSLEGQKGEETVNNDTGAFVDKITNVPQWILKLVVAYANYTNNHRGMPNWLWKLSPFNTSVYITDIGSTGIGSVYHHIYNFGTTSVFIAMGKRQRKLILDEEGNPKYINTINFRYVVDERSCDGFYYAKTARYITHLLTHPEELLEAPETVTEDPLY